MYKRDGWFAEMPIPCLNDGQRSYKAVASAVGPQLHTGEAKHQLPGQGKLLGSLQSSQEGKVGEKSEQSVWESAGPGGGWCSPGDAALTLKVLSPVANFIAVPDLLRAQDITGQSCNIWAHSGFNFLSLNK